MKKEMLFTFVVGAIMLFSVAGFAMSGLRLTGDATNDQGQQYEIPVIVDRLLLPQEKALILNYGKVLIENIHDIDCDECKSRDAELEMFANKYANFLVLESVETNETSSWKFQMVGGSGQIIDLGKEEITQENLLGLFCQAAVIKPKECLLKIYGE